MDLALNTPIKGDYTIKSILIIWKSDLMKWEFFCLSKLLYGWTICTNKLPGEKTRGELPKDAVCCFE